MRMTTIVGPPRNTESGMRAVRLARPRSARNIIRLRSLRSARAPASIPRNRSGRVCRAPTTPIARPGPGERQDQQRERGEADGVAECGDALRAEEDLEVPVPGERDVDLRRGPGAGPGRRASRWSPGDGTGGHGGPYDASMQTGSAADAIVRAGRRLGGAGPHLAGEGNLSVRLDDARILVTPAGRRKDELDSGRPRRHPPGPSGGGTDAVGAPGSRRRRIWGSIGRSTRARPDVQAVVHAHLPGSDGLDAGRRDPGPFGAPRDRALRASAPLSLAWRARERGTGGARSRAPGRATRAAARGGPPRAAWCGRRRSRASIRRSIGSSSSRCSAERGEMRS